MEPERSAPEPGGPPRRQGQRPRFPRRHPGPRRDQPHHGPRPEAPPGMDRTHDARRPTVVDALRQIDLIRKTLEGVLRDMGDLAKMIETIELDQDASETEIQKLRDALNSLDRSH